MVRHTSPLIVQVPCLLCLTGRTFQEGYLSKRLLIFGEHQMSFKCKEASWTEACKGPGVIKYPSTIDWNMWTPKHALWSSFGHAGDDARLDLYRDFISLLGQYTQRTLRFESDALNAFRGVMHQFESQIPPIYNFAGLPFIPAHDSEQIEKLVGYALSWEHSRLPKRRPEFPSWTWAGWDGPVSWPLDINFLHCPRDSVYFIDHIYFGSADAQVAMVSVHSQPSQKFLNTVVAISFEAPCIPATHFTAKNAEPIQSTTTWDDIWVFGARLEYPCGTLEAITPMDFLDNLEQGLWSCFLLSINEEEYPGALVLVVEWQDDKTAVRVDGIDCYGGSPADIAKLVPTLERRNVRLI